MILHRYFARRFAMTFLGVLGVFGMILSFIDLIEQMRRFTSTSANFAQLVTLTLLNLPQAIYDILPLIVILTAIALFLSLARSSEMVVTRAAGRSALRALVAPVFVALIIGIIGVAVVNPIVAATQRQYETRADALRGQSSVLNLGSSGLWLRQGDALRQTVIQAQSANLDGTVLHDVTFLTFHRDSGPTQRIIAERAQLVSGGWDTFNTKSWPLGTSLGAGATPETSATYHDRLIVPSTLTADQIRDSFGTPASIPIWDLPRFIDRLKTAGFSAQRHEVWLQMELAQPIFLVAMVMIGASFTLRHQRGGRTGLMVLFAILLSFAIYFLRNFTQILGENGQLPAVLAAWAPPLAAIGIALGFLLHQEDG